MLNYKAKAFMLLTVCSLMHGWINPSIISTPRVPMDLRPLPLTLSIDGNKGFYYCKDLLM